MAVLVMHGTAKGTVERPSTPIALFPINRRLLALQIEIGWRKHENWDPRTSRPRQEGACTNSGLTLYHSSSLSTATHLNSCQTSRHILPGRNTMGFFIFSIFCCALRNALMTGCRVIWRWIILKSCAKRSSQEDWYIAFSFYKPVNSQHI